MYTYLRQKALELGVQLWNCFLKRY
jgi:hypothetical protein